MLRSLGCILTETDWVAPTYTATGNDATAGEGWGVRNRCGTCLLNQLGGTPLGPGPCGREGKMFGSIKVQEDEAQQDVTWAYVLVPRARDVLVRLVPPLANINQETKVKCNCYTSTALCLWRGIQALIIYKRFLEDVKESLVQLECRQILKRNQHYPLRTLLN